MFLLRSVNSSDVNDLYELSGMVSFINLPHDLETIQKMVKASLKTFTSPSKDKFKNYYIFVLEDLEKSKVIGASMIHGQHGTDEEPHYFLKVGQENKYSETINTGFIHGTLKLDYECNGYTEIGGLVISPSYRNHKDRLGKQISFIRFLYLGLYANQFTPVIHSELMPPLDKEGNSPLWEAIGRRFMNMDYQEADKLSRNNKEFILSLFPSEMIYTTLLPVEARDSVGKVGDGTKPVKKMLEAIGFQYTKDVDPFDGGPHYRAKLKDIKPVREMLSLKLDCNSSAYNTKNTKHFLVKVPSESDSFKAISCYATLYEASNGLHLALSTKDCEYLQLDNEIETHAIYL